MNRHMIGAAVIALFLAADAPVIAQTAARVEYRDHRIAVAVALADLPLRAVRTQPYTCGWVTANLGPLRMKLLPGQPAWRQTLLRKKDLRQLLGPDTVRMLERHALFLGHRGPLQGQWLCVDRRTVVLEIMARGAPVAKFYDYGGNGFFERMDLASAPRPYR